MVDRRLRTPFLILAFVVIAAACGSSDGEVSAGSSDETSVEAPPDGDGMRVGCSNGPFFPLSALDVAPPLLEEIGEPGIVEAIAPFLTSEEGGFWPQDGWRVLELVSEDNALLVNPGTTDEPNLAFMTTGWESEGWRWSGASGPGDCTLVFEPQQTNLSVVDWELDPAAPAPASDSTEIDLLASERACASGQPMGDRFNEPQVVLTEDAVLIGLTAEPPDGDQNCPSNPDQSVRITLSEPLGDRAIRDIAETDLGDLRTLLLELIEGQ